MAATIPSVQPSLAATAAANAHALSVDVAIVGGGIVGLTLAVALRQSGLRVAIIEAQTARQSADRCRAYAFSLTSADIFKGLGLWPQVGPAITPFSQVRLSDGDAPQVVQFFPTDLQTEAVYYAAPHSVLMAALQSAVQADASIHYLCSARLEQVHTTEYGVSGQILSEQGNIVLQTSLLVAADGSRSPLRQQAGIQTIGWKYWQSCITAVLEPECSHQNIAYERFWPSGPFAILPLPDNRCQIVWTAPHAEAQRLLQLPRPQFMAELEQRYGAQMGRLTLVTEPLMFPVQLMQSQRYSQPRLALIGDAAHSCHPVGGQGLNMGIRDAAALAEVLAIAHHQGEDIGSLTVLRRYERWRQWENWLILSFTDGLNRGFSNRLLPIVMLRRFMLWIMQHIPGLKRLALRLMTGKLGRLPQIARAESVVSVGQRF